MKKETKKLQPATNPAEPIAHNEEFNQKSGFKLTHEQEEAANAFYATPLLYYLEISKSAEEFYSRLSEIILDAHKMTDDERQWLANLVQKPWKPKRGAETKEKRYQEIFYDYHLHPLLYDAPSIRRADAVREIMDRYKLTADAAGKSYDIAKKWNGEAPPQKKSKAKIGNK